MPHPRTVARPTEWVDQPPEDEPFAFTPVMAGSSIGFEKDVPFVTGLVKLAGTEILLTARIDGARDEALKIGDAMRLKVIYLPDGRVWFRFIPVG